MSSPSKPQFDLVMQMVTGNSVVGFPRRDGLFHAIAIGEGGAVFEVSSHFVDCEVCREYGVTEGDFALWFRGKYSS